MDTLHYEEWVNAAQYMTIFLSIGIIILEWWRGKKKNGGYFSQAALLIMWMVHTLIYYVMVQLHHNGLIVIQNSGVFFTSWSATLRLHGYTSLFLVSLLHVNRIKLWKRRVEANIYGTNTDIGAE